MSSAEESPAQRAARLRRERREAKIKEGGAARLDKITSLSGRTPSKNQEDASPSPSLHTPTVIPSPSPSPEPRAAARPAQQNPFGSSPSPQPQSLDEPTPDMLQAQQMAMRALLRQQAPSPGPQGQEEDPALKLFNALIGGMPAAASQAAGSSAPEDAGAGAGSGGGAIADLASALGLPPFFSNMLGAATQPQSDEQKKAVLTWKIMHVVFAVTVGVYLLFLMGAAVSTYGSQPPPPATVQNPFVYFTTGEVVLCGARILMKSGSGGLSGPFLYIQLLRDVVRDGSLVLFLFGMGAWWNQGWTMA